jgi:hypothetical protein
MRLFIRTLAAAILAAGCCLFIPTVSVLAQSPSPAPSTSAPELSDQKLDAVAAALERIASLQKDTGNALPKRKHPPTRSVSWRKPTVNLQRP